MLNKQKIKELQQQLNDEQRADASRYHQVFVQHPEGAKILQDWISTYVFGESASLEAGITELAMKEARRQFVTMITTKIALAENPTNE